MYGYDVLGKLLVNKKTLSSGLNSFTLKSRAGIYFENTISNNQTLSKKVM
jgi:hypothetical protein